MAGPTDRKAAGWKKVALATACLFVVLCLGRLPLVVDDRDQVQRLDAVVVLAGKGEQDAARMISGVRLFLNYDARYLILPLRHRFLNWDWFVRRYGLPGPVRETSVVIGTLDGEIQDYIECCGGTYAEAVKTYQLVSRLGINCFAVVSSSYHLLRARMAFQRVFPDADYRIYYVPGGNSNPRLDLLWWTSGANLRAVFEEYKKLLGGYFIYKAYRP